MVGWRNAGSQKSAGAAEVVEPAGENLVMGGVDVDEFKIDQSYAETVDSMMRGFTMRTTPMASTDWSFRFRVMRTLAFTGRGRLVQTKQPPRERSEVTPSARVPASMSRTTASAAKG